MRLMRLLGVLLLCIFIILFVIYRLGGCQQRETETEPPLLVTARYGGQGFVLDGYSSIPQSVLTDRNAKFQLVDEPVFTVKIGRRWYWKKTWATPSKTKKEDGSLMGAMFSQTEHVWVKAYKIAWIETGQYDPSFTLFPIKKEKPSSWDVLDPSELRLGYTFSAKSYTQESNPRVITADFDRGDRLPSGRYKLLVGAGPFDLSEGDRYRYDNLYFSSFIEYRTP